MISRRLIALLAPGSAEAEVSRAQNALFAASGLSSAAALPPMIPVGFVGETDAAARLDAIRRGVRAPYLFRSLSLRWEDGGLYLALETGGVWKSLRALGGWDEGPFPAAEGFVMGCWEAAPETRRSIDRPIPSFSFSSCSAALVILRAAWEKRDWWRELYTEIVFRKPLR
jgi:hypothetical protein